MPPAREKNESQIGSLVNHNLTLLKSLVDQADPTQPCSSTATSHLARFKLWSAGLGAHRSSGTRALEYRLRDASSVRKQVLSLLQDLSTAIDEARAPAEEQPEMLLEPAYNEIEEYFRDGDTQSQTPLHRSLAQVGYILDCLLRLSSTISNPAPHDHFESRVESSDYYEPWDVRHVQEKFTDVDPDIAMRLGKAITMRRHYFNYRQEHYARLAKGIGDDNDTGGDRTTIASSIPGKFKDIESLDHSNLDKQSEFSPTSYAPSSAEPDQLKVPDIPEDHIGGPFLCPFCQTIIEIDARRDWKQHVFRDLRPYVCLDKTCKTPNQQYTRRSHWIAHMTQEHWTMWHCSFGCSELFLTRDTWRKHRDTVHGQEAPIEGLHILEERSAQRTLHKAADSCPLCSNVYIKDSEHYSSHVGYHLEQLALFSLPKLEGDDGDIDGDAQNGNDSDDSDDGNEKETTEIGDMDSEEEHKEAGDKNEISDPTSSAQTFVAAANHKDLEPNPDPRHPFKCTYPRTGRSSYGMLCGMSFTQSKDLVRHVRSAHTSNDPVYRCRCGLDCVRKENHLRHVRGCLRSSRWPVYSCMCRDKHAEKADHLGHVMDCAWGFTGPRRPASAR